MQKFTAGERRLFFTHEQALQLWGIIRRHACETSEGKGREKICIPKEDIYKFIHAMGSSLLLGRKMHLLETEKGHNVWRYYSELFDESSIIEQWENVHQWTYNCDPFVMSQCGICLEGIKSNGKWATCGGCQQHSHVHCKLRYLTSLQEKEVDYSCEYCRRIYKKDTDVKLHKYDYYYAQTPMRKLSWKDHLGI